MRWRYLSSDLRTPRPETLNPKKFGVPYFGVQGTILGSPCILAEELVRFRVVAALPPVRKAKSHRPRIAGARGTRKPRIPSQGYSGFYSSVKLVAARAAVAV